MTTKEEAFFGVKNTVEDPSALVEEQDDVNIEVVDDTPEEDQPYVNKNSEETVDDDTASAEEPEIAKVGKRAQDRIKKLKWEYHEERRAKEKAERMSDEAIRATQQLHTENQRLLELVKRSQSALTTQAEGRANAAVAMAENMLVRANETGDAEAISTAQKHLIEAKMIQNLGGFDSGEAKRDRLPPAHHARGYRPWEPIFKDYIRTFVCRGCQEINPINARFCIECGEISIVPVMSSR